MMHLHLNLNSQKDRKNVYNAIEILYNKSMLKDPNDLIVNRPFEDVNL